MNFSQKLWYKTPANDWNQALPLGNGRIGAMVFSQPVKELISLNEDSIWSGGYRQRNNPNAYPNLEKVRTLLFEEKISEAEEIVYDAFCGTPINERHYMPLGDFHLEHIHLKTSSYSHDAASVYTEEENYGGDIQKHAVFHERSLDLSTAVCNTSYDIDDIHFERELFISAPDQVMVLHMKASKPGSIHVRFSMDGRDDYFDDNSPIQKDTLLFCGGSGAKDGIQFAACARAFASSGSISSYGSFIVCENCDELTILIGVQTSFRRDDYQQQAMDDVEKAGHKSYEQLLKQHIKDYQSFDQRAAISLEDNSQGNALLPTDERIQKIQNKEKDNKLIELYHHFGRYLMIAGSRENTLPTNLQGIWNQNMWPAWGSRFTININTEMNYWPAENCNLSELHMPLFDHLERMRPHGQKTAQEMYHCRGFVCHHNTDIWGDTAPQDLWMPGTQWPMGAAWLCLHLWEHYQFTKNLAFLQDKYDMLKDASLFFVDFLIEDGEGHLVTCPSVSPENTYLTASGSKGSLCIGPSMDSQIITELFQAVIQASLLLNRDEDYRATLKEMCQKLPQPEIGKYGQIKEWAIDYDEVEPGHRHISQLFALYPGDLITMRKTPELAKAARATLERRLSHGGGHTGWSRAWIINHWARLFDGEKVLENIYALLAKSTSINLFDMHPPFQIDGNFGGTAGITEALLQSENNEILLLPALPADWSTGSFHGLRARGGFEIDADWKEGTLTHVKIQCIAPKGQKYPCHLVCHTTPRITSDNDIVPVTQEKDLVSFEATPGAVYILDF